MSPTMRNIKGTVSALLVVFLFFHTGIALAQESPTDSADHARDSIIQELRSQLDEMKIQELILQEELQRTGQRLLLDSLSQLRRRQHIDSLRQITPGVPLVVDDDTLLTLYARHGGVTPEQRVAKSAEAITSIGEKLTFRADSLYIFEGDASSDIMAGNEVIISITDMDALWQGKERAHLAEEYRDVIQQKVNELHEEYGLHQKLWSICLAFLILLAQYALLRLTAKLFRHWRLSFIHKVIALLQPLKLKDYEILNTHRQSVIAAGIYNVIRYIVIILQLFISIPLLFSIFPETETLTYTILGYLWNPFKGILAAFIGYMPKVFQIIVIWACFHYILRLLRYLANEIEAGHLKLSGFYPDWAQPTYYILRILLYSLMFVMIWPLLPNSGSQVFQGVSVFIGIVVSLGSTSIIGNIVAGLVMTYMRPFRIGDYIKVGDTVGEVVEKTILVTRIRTRKNELVTIQNSSLMASESSNFTVAAQNYGLIVHTKVTIGYDVPWQKVKQIMESAALETPGIKHEPHPYMMVTALNDFYVEYEINAVTENAVALPTIYSALHQNLLKRFFEEGVEIMSPHIYARRDGIDTQMPEDYLTAQQSK